MVEWEWEYPWSIVDIVEKYYQHLIDKQHKSQHTLREGNTLAYYLANTIIDKENNNYENFSRMESIRRTLIYRDKLQCPYLKVSPIKECWK